MRPSKDALELAIEVNNLAHDLANCMVRIRKNIVGDSPATTFFDHAKDDIRKLTERTRLIIEAAVPEVPTVTEEDAEQVREHVREAQYNNSIGR